MLSFSFIHPVPCGDSPSLRLGPTAVAECHRHSAKSRLSNPGRAVNAASRAAGIVPTRSPLRGNRSGMTCGSGVLAGPYNQKRSTAKAVPAKLIIEGKTITILFSSPVMAPCPGQSAVIYDGDVVIGGGNII